MSYANRRMQVAFISSYPPRECGIATFTQDLALATKRASPPWEIKIAAINEAGGLHPYPDEVVTRIDQGDPESYVEAARFLNRSGVDAVSVQHEFGRFAEWEEDHPVNDNLIPFLDALEKPVVITLHTVLPHPHPIVKQVIVDAINKSDAAMVMAKIGAIMLTEDYKAPTEKIVHIPHGMPEIQRAGRRRIKAQLGVSDRQIISTFGLISPNKGLEYAIQAIPKIAAKHPDVLYLIVGQTHPDLLRHQGEVYRNGLQRLVRELGIGRHVAFVNHYLNKKEIVEYLLASDVYVTPYLDRNQITSGTLTYALGAGKAIVSTPYVYATEALAEHRGILAEFRSSESIANSVLAILDDPHEKETLERNAYAYGRLMAWPHVGRDFARLLKLVIAGERPTYADGDPYRLVREPNEE